MKLLKTYGRKFKTSILEASNSKRDWSPEVVVLRSPRRNRSEILFDSICQPTSKPPRQRNRLGRCEHDSGLFDITPKQGSDDSSDVSLSPPGKVNRVQRKGRQRNCNTRKRMENVKPCREAKGHANRKAVTRKPNGRRPLTKLSLKTKRRQVNKKPSPSLLRNKKLRRGSTSTWSGSTASSTSSCEIQRRCLQDTMNSFTFNKRHSNRQASSAQHSTKGPLKCTEDPATSAESLLVRSPNLDRDEDWHDLAGTNCFKLSLSDIRRPEASTPVSRADCRVELSPSDTNLEHRSLGKVSPITPKRSEGPRRRSVHFSDSSASSFIFPVKETDWVTTRKKKRGSQHSRHDGEDKKARLSFEAKEGPAKGSRSPWSSTPAVIAANWSPFLVSTPVSHARMQGAQARRAWFLDCATQTPLAPLADVTNSLLAPDSLLPEDRARGTTLHGVRANLKRKLSGTSQFENILNKSHRSMSLRNAESLGCFELESPRKHCRTNQSHPSKRETPRAMEPALRTEHTKVPGRAPWETVPLREFHIELQKITPGVESKHTTTSGAGSKQAITSGLKGGRGSESWESSKEGFEHRGKLSWQHVALKEPRVVLVDILNVTNAQQCKYVRQPSRLQTSAPHGSTAGPQNKLGVAGAHQHQQKVQSPDAPWKNGSTHSRFPQCTPTATAEFGSRGTTLLPVEDALRKKFLLKEARIVLTPLANTGQGTVGRNEKGTKQNNVTSFLPSDCKRQCNTGGDVRDRLQQLSVSFAEAHQVFEADSTNFPSPGNRTQFDLRLGECSDSKRAKILTVDTPSSDGLVLELSQLMSATANYTKLKSSAPKDEVFSAQSAQNAYVGGRTRLQARLGRMATEKSTSALGDPLTAETNVTVRNPRKRSGLNSSSRNECCQPIQQCWVRSVSRSEQCAGTTGLFKDPGMFLATTDKRRRHATRLVSDAHLSPELEQPARATSCSFSRVDPQTTATMKQQGQFTMARKSLIPSAVLLDANLGLLGMCNQKEPLTFEQALGSKALKSCRKIGEGTFGEVYRIRLRARRTSAIKIVPIEGSLTVNGERQKTAAQILPEAIISVELSALSGQERADRCLNFIEVKRLYYIQDCYHPHLMKQWDAFDAKKSSENDRPDCFGRDQRFLMLEFADGGSSLEDYRVKSATEARSIFLQAACALAVAETALEFEHRDLHWGNILVAPTRQRSVSCRLAGRDFELDCAGVFVSLIDYTLSRIHKGGAVMFTDVSSEDDLFEGSGDYQFDIYRLMREHNQNDWKSFRPYTNVLWLHYLSRKLLEKRRYTAISQEQCSALAQLRQWSDTVILECRSSVELFFKCTGYKPNA